MFTLCHTPVHQCLLEESITCTWWPVFVGDTQGTPFNPLVLLAREICVPWSHGTVAVGRTIHGRLPSPGHCTDSGLRPTSPTFCEGLFP